MGELGFLGLDKPEQYGGQGGDYYTSLVLAEEIAQRQLGRPGDGRRGAHRHGDAADPRVRHRGAEAGVGRAGDQGREDPLPRHHRARRRLGRLGDQDAGRARRRRLRHQRLQDLHHQRPPRRRDRARHQDRPRRRLRRLHAVPGADGRPRRDPREAPGEARHARLGHGAARLPGRARARHGGARPGRQGLLPHHVGAPGRAPDRRRRLRRREPRNASSGRSPTPTSARPSAAKSASSR